VFKRNSKRLADEIKDSVLQIVEGAGHMVHHFAPRQVAQAIESMARAADPFVTHLADHVTDAA
jgi:pimeloyl-ACP methyl ester carboxylesterase